MLGKRHSKAIATTTPTQAQLDHKWCHNQLECPKPPQVASRGS